MQMHAKWFSGVVLVFLLMSTAEASKTTSSDLYKSTIDRQAVAVPTPLEPVIEPVTPCNTNINDYVSFVNDGFMWVNIGIGLQKLSYNCKVMMEYSKPNNSPEHKSPYVCWQMLNAFPNTQGDTTEENKENLLTTSRLPICPMGYMPVFSFGVTYGSTDYDYQGKPRKMAYTAKHVVGPLTAEAEQFYKTRGYTFYNTNPFSFIEWEEGPKVSNKCNFSWIQYYVGPSKGLSRYTEGGYTENPTTYVTKVDSLDEHCYLDNNWATGCGTPYNCDATTVNAYWKNQYRVHTASRMAVRKAGYYNYEESPEYPLPPIQQQTETIVICGKMITTWHEKDYEKQSTYTPKLCNIDILNPAVLK